MMEFEFDPKKLIEEVKKRSAIWDSEHPDYRDKKARCRLWNEIVKELLNNEHCYSKSDIRDIEQQIQTRWKGMRDYYLKHIKKSNKGKPYVYYEQLQFLNKVLHPSTLLTECTEIVLENIHPVKESLKREKPSWSDDDADDQIYEVHQRPNISRQEEFAFADVEYRRDTAEDPDKMFLLSLLPHLKTVPDRARLNLKTEIMKLIQAAQAEQ